MNIAYFDMFSGISGDMTLGAFIDLGVPVKWLKEQLQAIPLSGFDIRCGDIRQNGIRAVNVFVDEEKHSHGKNYKYIKKLISDSPLSDAVKSNSFAAFEKIARAESSIHGTYMESVHFHEVGGIDAIVDIVGAFLCVEYLNIQKVYASIVPLGSGLVNCSHGLIPVPAPATMAILKGVPVKGSGIEMEIVTPTGAAVITTLAVNFGDMPEMSVEKTGYGSGKKRSDSGVPNLLRIILGKSHEASQNKHIHEDIVHVVETSIDDMSPELLGYLMDRLFEAGALDVCHIPVQMKKNRPGVRLEVVCNQAVLDGIISLILTESTSTGLRFHRVKRAILSRHTVLSETPFGKIQVKQVTDPEGRVRMIPEYDVCKKIALENNLPIKDVYARINKINIK